MSFTSIIRKSASTLAPLASRLAQGRRHYHYALAPFINRAAVSPKHRLINHLIPSFNYSSAAESNKSTSDEFLLKIIDSEIQCAIESDDHERNEEIPSGFPFEIQDNPGIKTITLKRKYQDEDIQVEVEMPDLVTGENAYDDADNQSSVPIVVNVSKNGGHSLEFSCKAFPDEVAIDCMIVKDPEISEDQLAYEGPDFQDLDENLQKAFHKYLAVRGVKPSVTNFLHEYMINKDSREYLEWLRKLKGFVEA